MTVSYVDSALATSLTNTVTLAPPAAAIEGDLLVLYLVVGNYGAEAATLTLPDNWALAFNPTSSGIYRTFIAYRYAGVADPATVDFVYTATASMGAAVVVYRGAQRDFSVYPTGFFAPAGSVGHNVQGTSTALSTATAPATTAVASTEGVYLFAQLGTGTSPILDDVSPLQPMRGSLHENLWALQLVDASYATAQTAPTLVVTSSQNRPWLVASVIIEAYNTETASDDNYKSKLIRKMWPKMYNTSITSNLGKLLTVIGTSDNDIGGLYGDDDFL